MTSSINKLVELLTDICKKVEDMSNDVAGIKKAIDVWNDGEGQ